MNILIADENTNYRLTLKSYLHQLWPEALVYEESNLDSVIRDVFDVSYDLLILANNIPGNEQLADFVKQAIKYTKVIICGDYLAEDVSNLKDIGADAFLLKSLAEEEVLTTLLFVVNDSV